MCLSPCQELNTNVTIMQRTAPKNLNLSIATEDLTLGRSSSHALHPQHPMPVPLQHPQQRTVSASSETDRTNRRVVFSESACIIPSTSPLDYLSCAEQSALWYHVTDLEQFRTEVRDLCRQMRVSPEPVLSSTGTSTYSLGAHFHTRGLEQRACLERQRRKYLSARFILRAQSKVESEDHLALIAHKCTAWATVLAREEAARDVIRAYGPESTSSTAIDVDVIDIHKSNTTTSNDKRGLAELLQGAAASAAAAAAEPPVQRRRLNADVNTSSVAPAALYAVGVCRI
jgi:hypothetical protein